MLLVFLLQAAQKVETAIRGVKDGRLNDLQMMGVFRHTGCNESLNNLHIKVSVFHILSFLEIYRNLFKQNSLSVELVESVPIYLSLYFYISTYFHCREDI
jgi:hypothetical protein